MTMVLSAIIVPTLVHLALLLPTLARLYLSNLTYLYPHYLTITSYATYTQPIHRYVNYLYMVAICKAILYFQFFYRFFYLLYRYHSFIYTTPRVKLKGNTQVTIIYNILYVYIYIYNICLIYSYLFSMRDALLYLGNILGGKWGDSRWCALQPLPLLFAPLPSGQIVKKNRSKTLERMLLFAKYRFSAQLQNLQTLINKGF